MVERHRVRAPSLLTSGTCHSHSVVCEAVSGFIVVSRPLKDWYTCAKSRHAAILAWTLLVRKDAPWTSVNPSNSSAGSLTSVATLIFLRC
jgi:hypothetical protein